MTATVENKVTKKTRKKSQKTLRFLMHYIGDYWKDVILTWVTVFFEALSEITIAFLLQYLITAIRAGDLGQLLMWVGIIAAIAVVAAITGIVAGYWASSASAGFGRNLRRAMFVKIQGYSFKNIDKFSPSSIVTRTTTDVTNVQFAMMMILRTVIRAPMMMILALVMCFITAPTLSWIYLIIIPILLVVLLLISKTVHPLFVKIFDTYDALNESVEEDVDGIRVVKSFGRKEYHTSRFNNVSQYIYKNFVKAESILSFNSPVMNLAIYTSMILIAYIGSNMIISSGGTTLNVGNLTTLVTYVMMILMSLMMVSTVYVMVTMSQNSAERIVEIIKEEPDIKNKENPVMEVKDGSVDFDHVSFAYVKGKNVLQDVDLHFHSGETVGIIGPTGSSKTTLISLIARLYDVTEGSVKVGGVDVRDYDLKTLRDSVAVVLQKNLLFTGTIRDNLKWGKEDATDEEIWKACDLAQASEFLHRFPEGLDTQIVEGGNNVSGGQKQRLCIARALLKDPKILILDDSTSACDTHTDALIRKGLSTTRPDVTKFIIAQRVLSIKDCDTILVLEAGGKIVAQGNNDELMETCSVYKELYESQLGGGDFDAAD